ncbi:MAG: DUF2911 domain-containing protein [Polaribacter sp.]|uniref:DUF2911 domain-containing protein n=1 Tax=Polaribacter sp. TaxID=1920175 RepID=UPI002F35673B
MKKSILSIAVFTITLICSTGISAQEFDPLDKSPMDVARFPYHWKKADKVVKVTYSRPQLKGRTVERLAPQGKKWRIGANEATEVTFYSDVIFGGKKIKSGTYTMYAIPGEKEWTIAISSQLNVWGAYFHKDENDVARVKGTVTESDKEHEAFTIAFGDDMTMYFAFGKTMVSVSISKEVVEEIKN